MMTLKSGRKTSHALWRLREVQYSHTIAIAVKPPESPHAHSDYIRYEHSEPVACILITVA